MLHHFTRWRGATLRARDGEVGTIDDVYFDDEQLHVRYLVVDTGGWLEKRRVLISPWAVRMAESTEGEICVELTREQVRGSPPVETEEPVSRLYEKAHADYYRYPYYWVGPLAWGRTAYPMYEGSGVFVLPPREGNGPSARNEASRQALDEAQRSHLRSCREVIGYKAEAVDGSAGEIDDILINDDGWSVDQFVVDTRRWLPGGQVKVPAQEMQSIGWAAREVRFDTHKQTVRQNPRAH